MGELVLDSEQRRQLREDGYLLLPGLVPAALVEQALYTINHSLGSAGIDPAQLVGYRARTFTPELVQHPALTGLFSSSPLLGVAEAALGRGRVLPPREAQIALRFPGAGGKAVPHIDGISSPGNGVPPGTLYHFTALGGVFLSDVTAADRGNLTVWPGSHRLVEQHLRTHGVAAIVDRFPDLPLGPPHPILARAGDALLAHYQLAHGIAPNHGPHIRYAVFYRLFHAQHEAFGTRPLTDQWLEWEGLRATLPP
jgi:hypothetical protein